MVFQLSDLEQFKTAYIILFVYSIIMAISATIGYYMDKKEGFTNGYVVGIILSLLLWFMKGEKMSGL